MGIGMQWRGIIGKGSKIPNADVCCATHVYIVSLMIDALYLITVKSQIEPDLMAHSGNSNNYTKGA